MKKDMIVCDESGTEKVIEQGAGYPYSEGWIYIYNLELKVNDELAINIRDGHFASEEAFIDHIKKKIKEKRKDLFSKDRK